MQDPRIAGIREGSMTHFDCIIRNGQVATGDGVSITDIGITGGKIAAIGTGLGEAETVLDATGKLVLPGGIDSHAHIEQGSAPPLENADTFESATASALAGGTTSVICFVKQRKGGSLTEEYGDYTARAARSRIDYGLHLIVTDPTPEVLDVELPPLVAAGNRSVKIFLTYDASRLTDGEAIRVLAKSRQLGALVCVHAEHHELITFFKDALVAMGLTAPKYHAWSKPMVVERECTARICAIAEALDTPIQVFHVSGAGSAEEIARAKARGLKVWAETCPQYLVLTADDMDRPGFEGAKYIFSPAARSSADQEALWDAIRAGVIDNVSSDHSPSRYEGPDGKQAFGTDAPFTKVPNGVPGLAARLPVLFSEGVSKGRIDVPTFVKLSATNPAAIFGLEGRKGVIAVGADADIAIWDPAKKVTLTNGLMHHGSDYTPFEGLEITGWPVTTLTAGRIAFTDGEVVAQPGAGTRLERAPYAAIEPRGVFPAPFNPVDRVLL